jgi:hypothetical protein
MFLVTVLMLVAIACPTAAWAYIDPSAGSIVLQLLLGGIAGAAVLVKLYYRRLIGFFRRTPRSADPSASENPDRQQ